jgi:hypothetical protein
MHIYLHGLIWLVTNTCPHRNRILTGSLSHAGVLGLNALLAECPEVLMEHFSEELPTVICEGLAHSDVSTMLPTVLDEN